METHKMHQKPTIFSFFSGVGILDLGFERAGFHIEYVNEFNAAFLDAYKYARKKLNIKEPKFGYFNGDIRDALHSPIKEQILEYMKKTQKNSLIGFIGGPPCPDFSIGGKNKGENGENGVLTSAYKDVIMEFTPDFFVFENVKGLLRTKKHKVFYEKIKNELSEKYLLTDRLTNSIEFGVPQDRDRIFLFGINKKLNMDLSKFNWNKFITVNKKEALDKSIWPSYQGSVNDIEIKNWQKKLTVEYWFKKNDVINHPNSKNHFIPRQGLSKFKSILEGDVSKKSYKKLHRKRYSPTAAYGNNEVHIHPTLPRRISAAEAMAIQSLPKEFELPQHMSLTNIFKTIGNGVPFLASYMLAKTIMDFIDNQ
ncbi:MULTISPECIES: DNA cytosine methyltransferase [Arsenophonus]|uniref:DNA cytosine methyltransferase n=1 Tax=Arsenophonus TaxID=637 RepID=UPI00387A6B54